MTFTCIAGLLELIRLPKSGALNEISTLMLCPCDSWLHSFGFTPPVCDFADGLTHWSLTGSTMTDEDTFMGFSDGLSQSGTPHTHCASVRGQRRRLKRVCGNACWFPVVSAEVEMTAYGLLTYTLLGDVASALPVVKWLSQQRNSLGGFSSTQVGVALCLQGLFHKPMQTTAIACLFYSKYAIYKIDEFHLLSLSVILI